MVDLHSTVLFRVSTSLGAAIVAVVHYARGLAGGDTVVSISRLVETFSLAKIQSVYSSGELFLFSYFKVVLKVKCCDSKVGLEVARCCDCQ